MQNKTTNYIPKNKELLVTSLFILFCLALFLLFPYDNISQSLTKSFFFLTVIPAFYVKFILKKNLRDFGLTLQDNKTGLLWGLFTLMASLLLAGGLLYFTSFRYHYQIPDYLTKNFWLFLGYELVLVNLLLFMYAFFFQGFMLNYFAEKIGWWAMPLQAIIFTSVLLLTKHGWNAYPLIIFSLAGGMSAQKSRSFIYPYLFGLIFFIILDSYLIHLAK